jgi:hypothetical protein
VQQLNPSKPSFGFVESWNTTALGRIKATIEGNCTTDTLCRSSRPLCYRTLREYHTPSHSLPARLTHKKPDKAEVRIDAEDS